MARENLEWLTWSTIILLFLPKFVFAVVRAIISVKRLAHFGKRGKAKEPTTN
jgi:hypothetical protein